MIKFLILNFLLIQTSISQSICGNSSTCPEATPCCSEHKICGSTPLHCSGCLSEFSFSKATAGEAASCYRDRPSIKTQPCVSGFYDFGPSTWILNTEAWNGDVRVADFTIDSEFTPNVLPASDGGIQLYLRAPTAGKDLGTGARVSSTSYLHYGIFSATILNGRRPGGFVSSFISMSDEKDEIDWEWTGAAPYSAQSNVFSKGIVDYTKGLAFNMSDDARAGPASYTVDWNADRIIWYINGMQRRIYTRADNGASYPSSAARIQFAVWDGSGSGSYMWAGGPIDWAQSGPDQDFSVTFKSVSIQCAGDPVPKGPPTRPILYPMPKLNERGIKFAVKGVGSDYYPVGVARANDNSGRPVAASGSRFVVGYYLAFFVSFLTQRT